jgi:Ca2+-binding EF-hand superfamily protein
MSAFDADKSGKMDFREYLSLVQAMIKRSSTEAR